MSRAGHARPGNDPAGEPVEPSAEVQEPCVKPKPAPAAKRLSELQSGVRDVTRCYVVPDWAGAVTANWVERAVLGVIDYWLGLDPEGRVRARGNFRTKADGFYWYVVTAAQLARQVCGSAKQVRRAVTRLDAEGLVSKAVHTRGDRNVALRLRLNWPQIEAAASEAWGRGDDDGG